MAILNAIVALLFLVALGCASAMRVGGMGHAGSVEPQEIEWTSTRPMAMPELPDRTSAGDTKRAAAQEIVERARAAFEAGRYSDTADHLERAVALDGSFTEGYVLLAYLHMMQGHGDLALAFLDQAEQLAADDPEYLVEVEILRGRVLEQVGRRDAARHAYRRALCLVPDDARARAGLARVGDD